MSEYYLRNLEGGFSGNSPCWVAKESHGYTFYIQNAHRYSEAEANAEIASAPGKYQKYNCEQVNRRLHLVFDNQDFKRLDEDPTGKPNAWGEGLNYAGPSQVRHLSTKVIIKKLVADYIEQDNRITAWPIQFQVQVVKDYPAHEDFGGSKNVWYVSEDDYTEFETPEALLEYLVEGMSEDEAEDFEDDFDADKYYMEFHQVHETVFTCFTEKQAIQYMNNNRHLNNPRTYVTHCGRGSEAEFVLRAMFEIAGENYDKHAK